MNTLKNSEINLIEGWLNEYGDKEIQKLVARNVAISNRIINILAEKKMSRVKFAELLGKKPSEITKLLSGRHNINTKTIVKMEVALEEDIISIIDDVQPVKVKYVYMKVYENSDFKEEFKPAKIIDDQYIQDNTCQLCKEA